MLKVKLSAFYFAYFALLGVMAPYLGLYLDSVGFQASDIGLLTGILMLTKVLAPNVWGAVADKTQRRLSLIRFGAAATFISYLGFFFADGFWQYAAMIMLFSFFWNAILPQFEVITLSNLKSNVSYYSRIRVWGSIGFIAAVLILGWVFERFGISLFPFALLCIIISILASTLCHFDEPKRPKSELKKLPSLRAELLRGNAYLFFVVCMLLQFSHGAYYSYYSLYLETLGYDKIWIGVLWAIGVVAEVVLFFVMHRWHAKHSVKMIMAVALSLSVLRWCLIASGSASISVLLFAQVLHAFSFGAMHAASIHFAHHHFSHATQGRAQSMYSSLGFGLGGSLGALFMALLVNTAGYANLFWMSAFVALCALLALIPFQKKYSKD